MRKARLSHGLLAATLFISASVNPCLAARFTDTQGLWSERYINTLSDQGVISAESDGKFRADEPITRATFAAWLVKVLGLEKQQVSGKQSYRDVKPTDWYYKPVEIIRQNNYIAGFADGFRPLQLMQKADAMVILARAMNVSPPPPDTVDAALDVFSDKSKIPLWSKSSVAQLMMTGVMVLPKQHELDPQDMLSRGDCAALLCKLSDFKTQQAIKDGTENPQQFQARVQKQGAGSGVSSPGFGNGAPPANVANAPPVSGANALPGQMPPPLSGVNGAPYMPPATQPLQPLPVTTIAKGTKLIIALSNSLNSGTSQLGDSVEGTVQKAYTVSGQTVIPSGAKLNGTVTNIISARKTGRSGYVEVQFTELDLPNGTAIQISGSLTDAQPVQGGGRSGSPMGGYGMNPMMGGMGGMGMGSPFGGMMGGGMNRRGPSEVGIPSMTNIAMQLSDVVRVPMNPPASPPQNFGNGNGTGNGAANSQMQSQGYPPPDYPQSQQFQQQNAQPPQQQ